MIKVERNITPLCLSPRETPKLVEKFKKSGEAVWNIPDLKWALLLSSHKKCAYCESRVDEESKYLEVEHYKHKNMYPDDVVTWGNLLPSCKRCNVKKGTHDVCSEPIINPYEMDPRIHLGFRLYRFRGLSGIGRSTIEVLDLNNYERVVQKRFEVGEILHKSIEVGLERLEAFELSKTTRNRNRLVGQVASILIECLVDKEYSATASTVLIGDGDYKKLVVEMKLLGLWDAEMEGLERGVAETSLSCV